MNVRGERIIVFGDSTSHHGADAAPEIWDVDTGSDRVSGQPGDLLASMLAEQGAAAVRVNARVGRSAHNFFAREDQQALLGSDQAFAPTKVIIILGTNDIGLNLDADAQAMRKLQAFYQGLGAEVWAVGPWMYANEQLNVQAIPVVDMMRGVFGSRFIDPRPITAIVGRARDGVHFGGEAAKQTAQGLLPLILKAGTAKKTLLAIGLGFAAVVGGAMAYSWAKKNKPTNFLMGPAAMPSLDGYKVAYATSGPAGHVIRIVTDETAPDLATAEKWRRKFKGFTSWIEDEDGNHVPTKGAMKPAKRDWFSERAIDKELPKWLRGGGLGGTCSVSLSPAAFKRCVARQKRAQLGGASELPPGGAFLVEDAARAVAKSKRWGKSKVFISDVHEELLKTNPDIDISLDDFKRELARMARDGNINLTRADLVAAMPAEKVAASETDRDGATAHFVTLDGLKGRGLRGEREDRDEFPTETLKQLIRDANTAEELVAAEDYALEHGIKLGKWRAFQLSPIGAPTDPQTGVSWAIEPAGKDRWDVRYTVMLDARDKSHGYIEVPGIYDYRGSREEVERKVAAQGWAVAKRLKHLSTIKGGYLPNNALRHNVVDALYGENAGDDQRELTLRPELFGLGASRWNNKKIAKDNLVDEGVSKRIYEAVKTAKEQKLHGGYVADLIERSVGRKLHGNEYTIAARAKEHLDYDPPSGYGGDKPKGWAAEPPRVKYDDPKIVEAVRIAQGAELHVSDVVRKHARNEPITAEDRAKIAQAADELEVAADRFEDAGAKVRAGTVRERARIARDGDYSLLNVYGL